MASYYSKHALCPYYQYDDPGACNMICESVVPGTTVKHHFANGEQFRKHAQKYCCENYKLCPWYKTVSMGYRE